MIFKPSQKDQAITFLTRLFDKKKHVKIEHITESKTLSQNSYLWLVFTFLADETGNSKDDIYCYYLERFPKFKEVQFMGNIELVRITLSQFNKEQASHFIEEVVVDARQEGFEIPDPEELKTLQMFNYYKQKGML